MFFNIFLQLVSFVLLDRHKDSKAKGSPVSGCFSVMESIFFRLVLKHVSGALVNANASIATRR